MREWVAKSLDDMDEVTAHLEDAAWKSNVESKTPMKKEDYWHVGAGLSEGRKVICLSIWPDLNDIMGAPMKKLTKGQAIEIADAIMSAVAGLRDT